MAYEETRDPYWSGDFIKKLTDAGVLPENTRDVTIIAKAGAFMEVHVVCFPKTEGVEEVLQGYLFKELDSAIKEDSNSSEQGSSSTTPTT